MNGRGTIRPDGDGTGFAIKTIATSLRRYWATGTFFLNFAQQQILNRYRAGQVSYTEVVTAQASALSARRTVLQLLINRQTAAVGLIQGLGGGWHAPV